MTNMLFEILDYKKYLSSGDMILQVGANDGITCEDYGLRELILNKEFLVHLVEPVPQEFEKLKINYANSQSHLIFHNIAIWDRTGNCDLVLHGPNNTESSLVNHENKHNAISINIPVFTFVDFITNNNLKSIDALFLDVEGVEGIIIRDLFLHTMIRPKIIRFEYAHIANLLAVKNILTENKYHVFFCPFGGGDLICIRQDLFS